MVERSHWQMPKQMAKQHLPMVCLENFMLITLFLPLLPPGQGQDHDAVTPPNQITHDVKLYLMDAERKPIFSSMRPIATIVEECPGIPANIVVQWIQKLAHKYEGTAYALCCNSSNHVDFRQFFWSTENILWPSNLYEPERTSYISHFCS
jgi:hypothetical protein